MSPESQNDDGVLRSGVWSAELFPETDVSWMKFIISDSDQEDAFLTITSGEECDALIALLQRVREKLR